jgi:hypothetical protein
MDSKILSSSKINPTKLLGGSSFANNTNNISEKLKEDSITISKSDLSIIKGQVFEIKNLVTNLTTLKKKRLKTERKETERKKFDKREKELEKKKKPEDKKVKLPQAPKLGFLDIIRRFVVNTLIGFIAIRLIKHLPKMIEVVKFLGGAMDFITNVGGNLLNGLATFVQKGYEAYDFTRKTLKTFGGDNAVKLFDGFNNALGGIVTAALAASFALFDMAGGDSRDAPGRGGRGGRYGLTETREARRGVSRVDTTGGMNYRNHRTTGTIQASGSKLADARIERLNRAGKLTFDGKSVTDMAYQQRKGYSDVMKKYADRFGRDAAVRRFGEESVSSLGGKYARSGLTRFGRNALVGVAGKGGTKALLGVVRPLLKRLPIIGALIDFGLSVALGEDPGRAAFKAIGAGLLGSIGAAVGSLAFGFGGIIGGILGSIGGDAIGGALYDLFFGNKKPEKQKVAKAAGGGQAPVTRGGKIISGPRRSITKSKVKRQIAIQPTQLKPGADVGGEKKIEKVFPKSKDKNQVSPLDYIEKSYKNTNQDKSFGSLLNLQTKSLVGQKPSKIDYKNAAQGLSNWMTMTFSDEILRTGAVYAAGGGEINADMLSKKSGDMTDAIARSLEDSISKRLDANIDDLMKQMMLKREETEKPSAPAGTQPGDGEFLPGSVAGGQMTMEQLVGLAKGAGFDDNEAVIMAAIAMAESSGNSKAHNKKPPDNSYGLWQINMYNKLGPARLREYGLSSYDQLFDPVTNAKAAYSIRRGQGLTAWSVYTSGSYKRFLSQAQAAKTAPSLRVSPSTSISTGISLGSGHGDEGVKIAGDLGDYMKQTRIPTGSIWQHPRHPRWDRRGGNSYHNSGRAIDLGGWSPSSPEGGGRDEQAPIIKALLEWSKKRGVKPVELIHGSPAYRGVGSYRTFPDSHHHHVHVAFFHGGLAKKTGLHMLHEGEFVVDKDSVDLVGKNFIATINAIENKTQLQQKVGSLIGHLSYITGYEPGGQQQVVVEMPEPAEVIPMMMPVPIGVGGCGGAGSGYDSDRDGLYAQG